MIKHEFELLAPAGDPRIFKAVTDAGADAVYFGGEAFGARAYAANFSYEEAKKAILYGHLKGTKAYLTVNTLLKNTEIERELYDYIKQYVLAGIDAFLVQDFGVFSFIREHFPDSAIHMSTQCALASEKGAAFFTKLGAKRIVLPRELSIEEMKSISLATGASLEAFVHGAICICYSGDCLMSSLIGGRSGNRGRCAQPCRLPYDVYENGKQKKTPGRYMLSPKELCGINDIEALYDAGIESLKIEGRMRSLEYAVAVTSLYRKYMDIFLSSGKGRPVSEEDMSALSKAGERCGHTNSYYYSHNDSRMFSFASASLKTEAVDPLVEQPFYGFKIDGEFSARRDEATRLTLHYKDHRVTVTGEVPEEATGSGTDAENIKKQLKKTGGTLFSFREIKVNAVEGLFIPLGSINKMRREALSLLENSINGVSDKRTGEYKVGAAPSGKGVPGIRLALFDDEQAAGSFLGSKGFNAIGLTMSSAGKEMADRIRKAGKSGVLMLPPVIRQESLFEIERRLDELLPCFDKFIAASFDGLALLLEKGTDKSDIILSPRMYTMSDRSLSAFEGLGITACIPPHELNKKELAHRYMESSVVYIYGRIPLMYMAACVNKNTSGCDKCRHRLLLKDRKGKFFPVKNDCILCMNTIYNSLPLSLLDEKGYFDGLGASGYIVDLCGEAEDEITKTAGLLDSFFAVGEDALLPFDTTKGHFNRGVE